MRKIFVRQMMSKSSIDAGSSLRRVVVMKSIRSVYNKAGTAVDIGELALQLVVNTTMAMIWGRSVEEALSTSLEAEFRQVVAEIMVVLGLANVSDYFPFIARFDIQVGEDEGYYSSFEGLGKLGLGFNIYFIHNFRV